MIIPEIGSAEGSLLPENNLDDVYREETSSFSLDQGYPYQESLYHQSSLDSSNQRPTSQYQLPTLYNRNTSSEYQQAPYPSDSGADLQDSYQYNPDHEGPYQYPHDPDHQNLYQYTHGSNYPETFSHSNYEYSAYPYVDNYQVEGYYPPQDPSTCNSSPLLQNNYSELREVSLNNELDDLSGNSRSDIPNAGYNNGMSQFHYSELNEAPLKDDHDDLHNVTLAGYNSNTSQLNYSKFHEAPLKIEPDNIVGNSLGDPHSDISKYNFSTLCEPSLKTEEGNIVENSHMDTMTSGLHVDTGKFHYTNIEEGPLKTELNNIFGESHTVELNSGSNNGTSEFIYSNPLPAPVDSSTSKLSEAPVKTEQDDMLGNSYNDSLNSGYNTIDFNSSTYETTSLKISTHLDGKSTEATFEAGNYGSWFFDDPVLPAGWATRDYTIIKDGGTQTEHEYKSPEELTFYSTRAFVQYLKSVATYSKEFIENVIVNKIDNVEMEKMLMDDLNKYSSQRIDSDDWVIDKSLPEGWKRRSSEVQIKGEISIKYVYLSPNNQIFDSRKEIVSFMKSSQFYSETDVKKALGGSEKAINMNYDEWVNDDSLPVGWKKRCYKSKNGKNGIKNLYAYLSSNLDIFNSRREIVTFMKNSDFYSEADIEKVLASKRNPVFKNYDDWVEDKSLPDGWKRRSYKSTKGDLVHAYLSSSNEIFNSRKEIVSFMKNSDVYTQVDIDRVLAGKKKISSYSSYSEWLSNDNTLPLGWKKRNYQYKDSSNKSGYITKYQYLSPFGKIFTARSLIVAHMKTNGTYTANDINKVLSGKRGGKKEKRKKNKTVKDLSSASKKDPSILTPNCTELSSDDKKLPLEWKNQSYIHKGNRFKSGSQKKTSEWEVDERLPVGWKKRYIEFIIKGSNRIAKKYSYISPNNQLFNSRKDVIIFMNNSDLYSQSDIEKVTSMDSVNNKRYRKDSSTYSEWSMDDTTLPQGWKKRSCQINCTKSKTGRQTNYQYLSPSGQIFTARSLVVANMEASGNYTDEEIIKVMSGKRSKRRTNETEKLLPTVQQSTNSRDWITDDSLPPGWKKCSYDIKSKKYGTCKKISYLSSNGQTFGSRKDIATFMKNSEEYSEADINKVLSGKGKRRLSKTRSNMEENEYNFIPDQFETFNISNTNNASVNQFNMEEKIDKTVATNDESVKKNVFSNWSTDVTLPREWKVRFKEVEVDGSTETIYQYLSPDKRLLKSRLEVVEYLKTLASYKQEIDGMLSHINQKDGLESINLEVANTEKLSIRRESRGSRTFSEWTEDDTLPAGWKKRSCLTNCHTSKTGKVLQHQYMSPSEEIYASRSLVIDYMKKSGTYKIEEIEKVLSGRIKGKGSNDSEWSSDDKTLPEGWKKRTCLVNSYHSKTGKIKQYQYMSPSQEIFLSRNLVINHMKKLDSYTNEEIEKVLSGKQIGKTKKSKKKYSEWSCDDESLPEGWKKRSYERANKKNNMQKEKLYQYLSPSEEFFGTRLLVAAHMKLAGTYSTEAIDKVYRKQGHRNKKSSLVDWQADENLPLGWKRKIIVRNFRSNGEEKSSIQHQYLSPTGKVFKTRKNVIKHMKGSPNYSIEDIKKIEALSVKFRNKKYKKRKTKTKKSKLSTSSDWEIDESLPPEWKRKSIARRFTSNGETKSVIQHQYLSPNGKVFLSRKHVIEYMRESQTYSKEDINKAEAGRKRTVNNMQSSINNLPHIEITKIAKTIPEKQDKNKENKSKPVSIDDKLEYGKWEVNDEIMPHGWKKRLSRNGIFQFLTPNNKILNSKNEVYAFMKNSEIYSLEHVVKFLTGIKIWEKSVEDASIATNKSGYVEKEISRDFECDYCNLKFTSPTEKMSHHQEEHTGDYRYACKECGKGDLKKTSLLYHVQIKHPGSGQFDQVKFDIEVPDKVKNRISDPCESKIVEKSEAKEPNGENIVMDYREQNEENKNYSLPTHENSVQNEEKIIEIQSDEEETLYTAEDEVNIEDEVGIEANHKFNIETNIQHDVEIDIEDDEYEDYEFEDIEY